MMRVGAIALMLLAGAASRAAADEVRLANGDVLDGKLGNADGKVLHFAHPVAGALKLPWDQVLSFASDGPVTLRLKDGAIYKGIVRYGPSDRQVSLQPAGLSPITGLTFDKIAAIGDPPPAARWKGLASAGLSIFDGNTRGSAYALRLSAQRKSANDLIEARAAYNYSEDDEGDLTARNGIARIQYNYTLYKRGYLYVGGTFEYDRFKFLNLRSKGGGGLGLSLIDNDTLEWRAEAGLEFVNEDRRNASDERYTSGRLATTFRWEVIPERIRFQEVFEFSPSLEDDEDFTIHSETTISLSLWYGVGISLSIETDYDESPPPGAKHRTDTKYQATVTWTF